LSVDTNEGFQAAAPSVAEATGKALALAGLTIDEVVVEVLAEGGGAAVPGERISGMEARVRVVPLPPEVAAARGHLAELLRLMEIEARVEVVRLSQPDGDEGAGAAPLCLQVDGVDLGILIGWRGEALRALQTVINLMVNGNRPTPGGPRVIVDVAHYRERRERTVAQMARRLALEVVRTGRPTMLDPMPPYERRAVHMALVQEAGVMSESTGADEGRRVVIRPRTGPTPPGASGTATS